MTAKFTGIIGVVLLAQALCVSEAFGQTRNALRVRNPGQISELGRSTGSSVTFSRYSYGLGSLSSGSSSGSSVLSSNMSRSRSYSLQGSSSAAAGNPLTAGLGGQNPTGRSGPRKMSTRLYSPTGVNLMPAAGSQGAGLVIMHSTSTNTLMAVEAYLGELSSRSTLLANTTKDITSLVPPEKSDFAGYLESGEQAFRAGDFSGAFNHFRLANHIASQAPEALLSMAHAKFALSRYSYSTAAHYIKMALQYFPELPLAALKPRAFYGRDETYAIHLIRLEDHLRKNPSDGEAALYMTYLKWFEGDTKAAQTALSTALQAAIDTHDASLAEAVNIFWDACVASGKVTGKLLPTTRPAAKTPGASDAASRPANQVGSN